MEIMVIQKEQLLTLCSLHTDKRKREKGKKDTVRADLIGWTHKSPMSKEIGATRDKKLKQNINVVARI